MNRITVEHQDYNNGIFTCECYDAEMADSTPDRVVTEKELAAHLGAKDLNRIPTSVTYDSADGSHMKVEGFVTLDEWQESNDLTDALEELINAREGRKGPLMIKPFVPQSNGELFGGKDVVAMLRSICEPSKAA